MPEILARDDKGRVLAVDNSDKQGADLPGRPTVMTQATLDKLYQAFSIGATDEEACAYAQISPATLYNFQKEHPEYLEQKNAWKLKPILKARQTVVGALESPEYAFRYLEKKMRGEFGNVIGVEPKVDVASLDGANMIEVYQVLGIRAYRYDATGQYRGDKENRPKSLVDQREVIEGEIAEGKAILRKLGSEEPETA